MRRSLALVLTGLLLVAPAAALPQQAPVRIPDAPFVPTPDIVVTGMLKMAALTAKDVALCVEAAREMNVPTGVAAAASQVYVRSLVKGYGPLLMTASMMTVEEEAGVKIEKKQE